MAPRLWYHACRSDMMLPACFTSCSGQAYVGAFLRKSDKADESKSKSTEGAGAEATAVTTDATAEPEDPAGHLYEVGTFAQVRLHPSK